MNRVPARRCPPVSIHIGNLSTSTSEDTVRDLFKDCGEISSVFVSRNYQSHQLRTYGFVRFTSRKGADKAVEELNGWPVHGMNIKVSISYMSQQGVTGGNCANVHSRPPLASSNEYINLSRFMYALAETVQKAENDPRSNTINPEKILKDVSDACNQLAPIISHPSHRSLDLNELENFIIAGMDTGI